MVYANQETKPKQIPTTREAREMLEDAMGTFSYAYDYEHSSGSGNSSMLIRAAKHAKDLGATREQVLNLMHDINSYWIVPLEEKRFDRTIIAQIDRWKFPGD